MKKIEVIDVTIKAFAGELKRELSFKEKLFIAKNLERLGVDTIELPSAKHNNEESIVCRTIAENVENSMVVIEADGEQTQKSFDAVKIAKNKRIQVVYPVSTVQMEYAYHLKAPKMIEKISAEVKNASAFGTEVEFVAKDATRAEEGFLVAIAKAVKENGGSIITICDDANIFFPEQFAGLVKEIKDSCDIKVFVQPSDALKMSVCTAIECIKAGADGIKTAVGVEGYLSPEVLSYVLKVKGDELGVKTNLDVTAIHKIVADIKNAANCSLEEKSSNAVDSAKFNSDYTLKDVEKQITALGYELSVDDVCKVYAEFERMVSKKGAIGERELEAIVASTAMQVPSTFHLDKYVVNSGNVITATANVTLVKDGEEMSGVSTGDGPIDAAFHAIEQIIGHHYELDDFNVQAVTKGREAVGSAVIRLRAEGKLYSGNGVSTDVVGACIRAYVNALNKIVYAQK